MRKGRVSRQRLPGLIAASLMIMVTLFWTFWGVAEMYHEGWWGAWINRLPYLVPILVCLLPTLAGITWPFLGGALILGLSVFVFFFFGPQLFVFYVPAGLVGALFLWDGVLKRRYPEAFIRPATWWRRHLLSLMAVGGTLLVALGVSAFNLPIVLSRQDDGDRSARLIEGNGVVLVWAPEGPGWNFRQAWGGYPSWQSVALYDNPPTGFEDKPGHIWGGPDFAYATAGDMQNGSICSYLSEDGLTLMDEPQDIWRMPTADELVRSLVHHGENAGCSWDGEVGLQVDCEQQPDKESPLWSTDHAAIYYWAEDEYDTDEAVFVSYNGWVNATRKTSGNPRHSYRCVREPYRFQSPAKASLTARLAEQLPRRPDEACRYCGMDTGAHRQG